MYYILRPFLAEMMIMMRLRLPRYWSHKVLFCIVQREKEIVRQWQWQCEKDNTTKVTGIASNRKAKPDAKPSKIYRWWVRDDGDHYVWSCARLCVCVCVCAWSMRVCVAYAQPGGLQYVGSISVSALHCLPSVDFVPPSPSLSLSTIPKQTAATIAQMTNWAPPL